MILRDHEAGPWPVPSPAAQYLALMLRHEEGWRVVASATASWMRSDMLFSSLR